MHFIAAYQATYKDANRNAKRSFTHRNIRIEIVEKAN